MKHTKVIIPFLLFSIISFALLAKSKDSSKDQKVEVVTIQTDSQKKEEDKVDSSEEILPIEDKSYTAIAKHMYDFQRSLEEKSRPCEPSQEVKKIHKDLDQCQYPNQNKRVVKKVRGIKSFITLFKYKKNIW